MKKSFFSFILVSFLFSLFIVSNSLAESSGEINKVLDILWGGQQKDNIKLELKNEDSFQNGKVKVYSVIVKDKNSDNIIYPPAYITQIDNIFIIGDIFVVNKDKVDTVTWQKRNDFFVAYQKEQEKKIPEKYTKIDKTKLIKIGTGKEKNEVVMFASLTCPHCQTALKEIINNKIYKKEDTTFYLALVGMPDNIPYVLCSANKEKAIIDILTNKKITNKAKQCANAEEIMNYYQQLASDFGIQGVPTFIAPKCIVHGYYPGFTTKIKECQ